MNMGVARSFAQALMKEHPRVLLEALVVAFESLKKPLPPRYLDSAWQAYELKRDSCEEKLWLEWVAELLARYPQADIRVAQRLIEATTDNLFVARDPAGRFSAAICVEIQAEEIQAEAVIKAAADIGKNLGIVQGHFYYTDVLPLVVTFDIKFAAALAESFTLSEQPLPLPAVHPENVPKVTIVDEALEHPYRALLSAMVHLPRLHARQLTEIPTEPLQDESIQLFLAANRALARLPGNNGTLLNTLLMLLSPQAQDKLKRDRESMEQAPAKEEPLTDARLRERQYYNELLYQAGVREGQHSVAVELVTRNLERYTQEPVPAEVVAAFIETRNLEVLRKSLATLDHMILDMIANKDAKRLTLTEALNQSGLRNIASSSLQQEQSQQGPS